MSGLNRGSPTPTQIILHQGSRRLELVFSDATRYVLSHELMRVYSPSAEVRGHGPGQEVLQTGKRHVEIRVLEPVGNYAVKPIFSDGHDTGIYSWDYLYWLGSNQERLFNEYLEKMAAAGASREPPSAASPDAHHTEVVESVVEAAVEIRRR